MAFETTKEVLDHAREFHRLVREFYNRLSKKEQKERVRILLDYMSRHQRHLDESLAEYQRTVPERILNTWFQYPPPKNILETCLNISLEEKENLTVDDVVSMALELDKCLLQLYQTMAEHSEFEEVRTVFTNLLEMEKRLELDFVRDVFSLKDI